MARATRESEFGKTTDLRFAGTAGESARSRCVRPWERNPVEAFLVSTSAVALAEIGDKTQLLAFLLAARFKKPWPIVAGIVAATVLNHAIAGAVGAWIAEALGGDILRWVLGLSFIAMAVWTLIPDSIEEEETKIARQIGVFGTTFVTFFIAEIGDKTQIATVALAAHYAQAVAVVAGTTLGMLIADVPAVFLADKFAAKIPTKFVHRVAAALFLALGLATLLSDFKLF